MIVAYIYNRLLKYYVDENGCLYVSYEVAKTTYTYIPLHNHC